MGGRGERRARERWREEGTKGRAEVEGAGGAGPVPAVGVGHGVAVARRAMRCAGVKGECGCGGMRLRGNAAAAKARRCPGEHHVLNVDVGVLHHQALGHFLLLVARGIA
jgi:hypothetical protein